MKNCKLMEKVFPGLLLILTIILIPGVLLFTVSDALAVGPYVDNEDGTVTDIGTGLMWQQSGDGVLRDWYEAYAYCGELVLAEFDDWRLPEVDELAGLKETNHPTPWINDVFDCYTYLYWSGTTSPVSSISAWAISFTTGGGVDGKQNPYYVRCTRDNSVPVPPIADSGPDQIVYEQVTLDGSQSEDPDGQIVSYHWKLQHRHSSNVLTAEGINPTIPGLEPGFYDVTLTVTDDDGLTGEDSTEVVAGCAEHFSDDTQAPTGAVHAYDNMIWSPNNKMVTVTLEGYVKDELSMARDREGIGVSAAYLLIGDTEEIILKDEDIDLLDDDGKFSVNFQVKAVKGAEYDVELYASDTESADDGEPNSGLVDSTFIRVPHDMSDGKSKK